MAIVVEMPKLTDTMEEGVLVGWRKNEGDTVNVDDVLGEVETDKATMELAAYDKGVLLKQLIKGGDSVPPGSPIAILGKQGEDISQILQQLGATSGASVDRGSLADPGEDPASAGGGEVAPPKRKSGNGGAGAPAAAAAPAVSAPRDGTGRVLASPLARRIAREQGIDLGGVAGSGPGGRIVARDVEGDEEASPAQKTLAPPKPAPAAKPVAVTSADKPLSTGTPVRHVELPEPQVEDGKVVPLSMMRKTIARRLTDSKSGIPHYYVTMAIDADPLMAFRARANADAAADEKNAVKLSVTDLLIKAVAMTLKAVPQVNAAWSEQGIVWHQRADIGIAVAMDEGLITPVVRNADKKTIGEIAIEVADLVKRARGKRLKPEEFRNGTFSISNLGMFGVSHFAAVINPPEAAILAVGAVQQLPVVRGDAVVPGHVLKVTMSCDHRVIDGAVAAQFLKSLRDLLEHPMRLVL